MQRILPRVARLTAALALASLALAACGGAGETASDGDLAAGGAAGGTCLAGAEDCADDPSNGQGAPAPTDGSLPDDTYVAVAKGMLGMTFEDFESTTWDVPVRVGRKGDESYMLTEDYVLGRQTVEFDEGDDGTFVVTSVTVELDGGPVVVDSLED